MTSIAGNALVVPAAISGQRQLSWTATPAQQFVTATPGWPLERLLPKGQKVILAPEQREVFRQSIPQSTSFEESIYNSLVSLKVAVSQYAMHLSNDERRRIFHELDTVINISDWHEGDVLPDPTAFQDFLKWMIYSKYSKWISIGVANDGGLLVAWKTMRVLLTAKFSGIGGQEAVRWTAKIQSEDGEIGHAVGKCPLRLFAEQALFYLRGADKNAGD